MSEPLEVEETNSRTKSEEVKAVESERLELLRAVAAVCPEDWSVSATDIDDYDQIFMSPYGASAILYLSGNDIEDAPAIILMLDEMEKHCRPAVQRSIKGEYLCWSAMGGYQHLGETRAEAVARAFVAVMSREGAPDSATVPKEPIEPAVTKNESQDIPVSRQPKRRLKIEE